MAKALSDVVKTFDHNIVNLESHQLVWLASKHIQSEFSMETLRKIIDYTKVFEDNQPCVEFIKNSKEIFTFLIISDQISEKNLFSSINDLDQVLGVYIHNFNNETYASNCGKVKLVSSEMNLILEKLEKDVQTFLKQDKSILPNNNNSNSNSPPEEEITHGDSLSWWSIFLDRLLYNLPYSKEECRRKLTNAMRDYYIGNSCVLDAIKEFEEEYAPKDSINWYTRDTFVYRVLNKALRQRNLTLLFLFRFFLQDLYEQLKIEYEKFRSKSGVIKVYRAQLMWKEEIEDIQNGYNKIVNWCLFSITRDRRVTECYINPFAQLTDRIQSVLFETETDLRRNSYPYADVSHLSNIPSELEVLFMIGTVFRKTSVIIYNDDEKRWLIKLELEEDRRKLIEHHNLPSPNNYVGIRSALKRAVRTLLQRFDAMSIDDIYTIFKKISELFPTETKWLLAIRSHCLANHHEQRYENTEERFQPRFAHYENALVIWQQYMNDAELNCYLDMADIHMEIGRCHSHFLLSDGNKVKYHFNLALNYYEQAQNNEFIGDTERTDVFENVIDIYQMKIDYKDGSIETLEMALKNRRSYVEHLFKLRDSNDITLIEPLERLAALYKSVEKYDEALINYETSVDISRKQSTPDWNGIQSQVKEIVDIYTKHKNDPRSALKYQDLIRDMELKEEVKFGQFMTALQLHKERPINSI